MGLSGGIAQLGERLNGIQEVSGSIPLISTKKLELRFIIARFGNKTSNFYFHQFPVAGQHIKAILAYPPN